MVDEKELLDFVRIKGPVIPSDVAKKFNLSILIASAILSEMVSRGVLKISSLKVGNSPVYYLESQREKLQYFASKLNEKDRFTYEMLKKKLVLEDSKLDPLTRVSLRKIKDFAKPFFIKESNKEHLFWRWYLLDEDSARKRALELLKHKEHMKEKNIKVEISEGVKQESPEKTLRTTEASVEKQESLKPVILETKNLRFDKAPEKDFFKSVKNFFDKNNIKVLSQEIIRKNREFDFVVEMKTPVGMLKYYCKVLKKKRVNEADLSKVFVQAQSKKLPAIFLITGKLTKKAKLFLNKELSNIIVKEI